MAGVNTEGEWIASPIQGSDGDWQIVAGSLVVATVEADHEDPLLQEYTENRAQTAADAKLFAASKELLAAAKLATLNFERSNASGNFLGDDDHEAWTALNAAIKKAEGV